MVAAGAACERQTRSDDDGDLSVGGSSGGTKGTTRLQPSFHSSETSVFLQKQTVTESS